MGALFAPGLDQGLGARPGPGDDPVRNNVSQGRMTMSNRWWLAAAAVAAVAAALVACGDAPKTTTLRRVDDPWAFAQAAMAAGPLLVVVRGLPARASEVAVEEAVLAAAGEAVTWTSRPRFTVIPARAGSVDLRLVYVFNGRPSDPCRDAPSGGDPQQGGRIALVAALCDGAGLLSRVDGRLARSDGVDDRRFAALIDQATRDLLAPPSANRP
jgi:hypothetical protein